ncbi:MAG: filamentous hemagglutinin N-terminal domain-containing protein [Rhizobacter sp.]|nr:filamentous hemagglutinin N-terminal domain-containing protein [Rhizobacter sp.]
MRVAFKPSPITLAALLALGSSAALAQPVPTALPVVKPGGALINATVAAPSGNTLAITQTGSASNRGLIEWSSFSIGSAASVNITQPNAQSVLVNRVVGNGNGPSASEIYGAMTANGRVFLVNPAGVVFGATAQVNVGSLVATSLDLTSAMSDDNYARLMSGDDIALTQSGLAGRPGLQVLAAEDPNRPQIQVTEGGSIVLISHDQVSQQGSISAPRGQINLTTATAATLRPVGESGFVQVLGPQPAEPFSGGVDLAFGSRTVASGGSIVVGGQPKEGNSNRSDSITIRGLVSADSSSGNAGSIYIDAGAGGEIAGNDGVVLTASSTAGAGGQVTLLGGNISVNRGEAVRPQVLAEGSSGGGSIEIGNDATRAVYIEQGAIVSTDATGSGNGGTIRLRAMYNDTTASLPAPRIDFGVTEVYGTLRSRGGTDGGNGGRIETSGMAVTTSLLDDETGAVKTATLDARARAAGGSAGAWTLDPYDVTISNGPTVAVNGSFTPTGPGANVQASDIAAALNAGTSVEISTDAGGAGSAAGNITFASDTTITRTAGTVATDLTLRANGNIFVNGTTIDATAAGPVNVSLYADLDGNGSGNIGVYGSSLLTGGGNLTLSGGTNPATGYAVGDAQNAGITLSGSTVDTRSRIDPNQIGGVTLRGRAGAVPGALPGVSVSSDLVFGTLTIDGRASHGTAVSLGGSSFTTAEGTVDVRGVATRVDTSTAQLIGVDTGALAVQIGTGSLSIAGRGDDGNLVTTGNAIGTRVGDLRITAAADSAGRITLAGQSVGATLGTGLAVTPSTGALVISANAAAPGNAATGASVVIGGMSDAARGAIDLGDNVLAPNIASSSGVNLRPIGVDGSGGLNSMNGEAIWIGTPTGAGNSVHFLLDPAWLRVPGGNSSGIAGGASVVIGSSEHSGLITVESGSFTAHNAASLTLQNQGEASGGILLGGGTDTIGNLTLISAGNVRQNGAITVLQGLALQGDAGSSFDLSNPGNQFGRVAFDPPGTLSLFSRTGLTVDAVSSQGFNTAFASFTPLAITNSTGGTTAVLGTSGDLLLNRSITMTGDGATLDLYTDNPTGSVTFANGATLTNGPAGGRWRIWSPTIVNGPAGATNIYGCLYGDTVSCEGSGALLPTTGNLMLRPDRPTLTVAANPATALAGQTPTLTYTVTGLANGDTAATALSGALDTAPTGNANVYSIVQGTLASPTGYFINFTPSTLTLSQGNLDVLGVTRHMLQAAFRSEMSSDVYGRNLDQPYICTAASVTRGGLTEGAQGDPLASEWGKVRNQPQLSGCLNVTDGGSCSAF